MSIITPSIYTVISKTNPTGVYSRLPNSYVDKLVFGPSVRPTNPYNGEQYYDKGDNTFYYWNGSYWVSGGVQGYQGFQGYQGLQGFQGYQGYQGFQGNTGDRGYQGFQGFQGFQGYQGFQGNTGDRGFQGFQGYQGYQGYQGFQGFQGFRGNTGDRGFQGFQGYQGFQGFQGFQGLVGQGFKVFATTPSYIGLNTVIATGGNIGEFVLVTGGDLFVYFGTGAGLTGPGNSYGYAGDVTDESKLVGNQGPIGFQGLAGSTGINGSQGTQGTQGTQGLAGTTGTNGTQGFQGLAGSTGINGSQGTQGFQGLAGSTGTNGTQGLQGLAGAAVGSLANVKLSFTRTTDSPSLSISGNRLYAFSGATGVFNTPSSNIIFTPSNGRFTVSEQGDYYLDARLIIKGNNNPDFITTDVYINSNTVYSYTHVSYGIVSPVSFPIGLYVPLNSNDYIHMACYSTGTGGPIILKAGSTMNLSRMTNGPSGPQGAIGSQGTQGFQGLAGSTGFNGLQGNQGFQGFQGLAGSTGFNGLQGNQGFQGLVGTTGSQGFQGISGGGSSQWISSTGGIIYYSSGSVGIGKANPTVPLDVVGTVSITGTLNISGNISYATSGSLINPIFQNYKETVFIGTSSSSSYVINCSTGNNFGITLATATTAFTFSGIAPTGTLTTVNLFLTQDSTGNRTATWPSSVSWGNPSTPVLSTVGGSIDMLSFTTFTGGSKWFGFLSGRGF